MSWMISLKWCTMVYIIVCFVQSLVTSPVAYYSLASVYIHFSYSVSKRLPTKKSSWKIHCEIWSLTSEQLVVDILRFLKNFKTIYPQWYAHYSWCYCDMNCSYFIIQEVTEGILDLERSLVETDVALEQLHDQKDALHHVCLFKTAMLLLIINRTLA